MPGVQSNLLITQLDQLRRETPGCAERIHMNNAGAGLMPQPVIDSMQEYLDCEARIGGYETADARAAELQTAYENVARLLGTESRNIAFVENTTVSLREYAVFDFDRKQVPWALRVSPHYYNSEEEIATVVQAIAEMAV